MRRAADVTIDPSPPTVDGRLPWVGAGLSLLRDPTAFFADARRRHGDTFVIDAFGFKMFCVFSPDGVRRLYDLPEIWDDRQRRGVHEDDFLEQLVDSYSDLSPDDQLVGAARDVIMLHVGAQSNLYAALAWTLVRVLEHPELLARIRSGDDDLLERCANEAIRMAQRSITLREVLTPIEIDDGTRTYHVGSGAFVTTMLSVTNTAAAPGLETFDPAHYAGRRLVPEVPVATKELVSTFGHGTHSCPAARFSISAIRIAVRRLVETYELTPEFHDVSPRRRQLGGVARAEGRARVRYERRAAAAA